MVRLFDVLSSITLNEGAIFSLIESLTNHYIHTSEKKKKTFDVINIPSSQNKTILIPFKIHFLIH